MVNFINKINDFFIMEYKTIFYGPLKELNESINDIINDSLNKGFNNLHLIIDSNNNIIIKSKTDREFNPKNYCIICGSKNIEVIAQEFNNFYYYCKDCNNYSSDSLRVYTKELKTID